MLSAVHAINRFAHYKPQAVALEGDHHVFSYASLRSEIETLSCRLGKLGLERLGILMDNSPAWIIADLAASSRNIVIVPLPDFFTDAQLEHVIREVALDGILTDRASRIAPLISGGKLRPLSRISGKDVWVVTLPKGSAPQFFQGTIKITFTSGTTGEPKGVCLSEEATNKVTDSLAQLITPTDNDKHLCLLPLSILLENIAGVYVALCRGVACSIPSLPNIGVLGASGLDSVRMVSAIAASGATSIITIPQMLQALVETAERGMSLPVLRFIAVGGAPVASDLLERAAALGLPVYEGYGLSECASVVAVNSPSASRRGSVGRPLPHVRVRFAADGEIVVSGNRFLGYLGDAEAVTPQSSFATGDVGFLDGDGYMFITGRKKNMFITSFGRNVSPEWVERELTVQSAIAQAVVFGEGRPWGTAVIVPQPAAAREDVDLAINAANSRLPDYARVGGWLYADEPFSVCNAQYTATGRPRRDEIWRRYASRIDEVYRAAV